jgi:hypothetical protein
LRAGRVAQVIECLPKKHKAQAQTPVQQQKKKNNQLKILEMTNMIAEVKTQ